MALEDAALERPTGDDARGAEYGEHLSAGPQRIIVEDAIPHVVPGSDFRSIGVETAVDRSCRLIARHASITPQAMNTVLRKLEDLGVVARPASVSSGRALPASLTSRGQELLERAEAVVRAADARILDRLTATEQREFKSMLAKLGSE